MARTLLAFTILLSACGGGQSGAVGTASLSGGLKYDAHSAISTPLAGGNASAVFWISDLPNACGDIKSDRAVPYRDRVLIGVVSSNTPVLQTGNYVINGSAASLSLHVADTKDDAQSGTITVNKADNSGVAGQFNAVFSDGGTLSGTFDAPPCSNL